MTKLPNMFIGSSREVIDYARGVNNNLNRDANIIPWYTAFNANEFTMEALERNLDLCDFGVFIFAADDVALHRGKYVFITRDNTVFEMGLFWGKLRRKRVFAIVPREVKEREDLIKDKTIKDFHILSDLHGLTILKYSDAVHENYNAAMDVACGEISKAVKREGFYQDPIDLIAHLDLEIERKQSILTFFYEYNKRTGDKETGKYHLLSEAIRNSFLPPDRFRVTGAAFWEKKGDEGISQIGGNVGLGKFYRFDEHSSQTDENKIFVVDVCLSNKWTFFRKNHVAGSATYVFCYPLNKDYVLSVHILGNNILENDDFDDIVNFNQELLDTLVQIIGGDLK